MKTTFSVAALALALSVSFSSTAATTSAGATAGDAFTPAQQARIGEIAADYLVAHPDVLIEVSKKLQARQEARRQAAYAQAGAFTGRGRAL